MKIMKVFRSKMRKTMIRKSELTFYILFIGGRFILLDSYHGKYRNNFSSLFLFTQIFTLSLILLILSCLPFEYQCSYKFIRLYGESERDEMINSHFRWKEWYHQLIIITMNFSSILPSRKKILWITD